MKRAAFLLVATSLIVTNAHAETEDRDPAKPDKPRLALGTAVLGLDLAHSMALGEPGEATAFGVRLDADERHRSGLLSTRLRLDLALGGGSQLTGDGGVGALGGIGLPLSPGKYLLARAGGEGFYRQRPRGRMTVLEIPKVELGFGSAPLALHGGRFLETLAMETTLSAGLVVAAQADDGDPTLERWRRSVVPSFGAATTWTATAVSLRAEVLHVQSDVSANMLRARPCLAAFYFAVCIDAEVQQARYLAPSGALVDRRVLSLGLLVGFGIAWFEPQIPNGPAGWGFSSSRI